MPAAGRQGRPENCPCTRLVLSRGAHACIGAELVLSGAGWPGHRIGPSAYDHTMTETATIVEAIDGRLRQLNEQIRTLTAARAALDGDDAPTTTRRERKPVGQVSRDPDGTRPPTDRAASPVPGASSDVSALAPQQSRARAKPRHSGKRRSVDGAAGQRLELMLSERGAMTTSALAELAGGNRDQILAALRELEAAGRVRRSGQRRSTRWHAITDEERIQKRAADLEARSKPGG